MSNRSIGLEENLYQYLLDHSLREPDVLRRLREETAGMEMARMQIAPEQGQFMQMLARLTGARQCLEIGTYTGYSSLAVALTLPADGRLIACDVSEEWTAVASRYWQEAGVAARIDLRLAPAQETLQQLIDAGDAGRFDFAFIDADKTGYPTYYEQCLQLIRPGGLIVVDNVLWNGAVADPQDQDPDTLAIRSFNRKLADDKRIALSMIPVGDGLSLARKL